MHNAARRERGEETWRNPSSQEKKKEPLESLLPLTNRTLPSTRLVPSPPLPTFFNKVSQIAASIGIHANMLPDSLNFQRANPRDTRPVPRPSPCTNLNRRFPPHSSPRRFAIFISNLSSSPITFYPSLSRSVGRNEFETLTEADSRLTSRRSNYRIFIRTHSLDGQLLSNPPSTAPVKTNPARACVRGKSGRERRGEERTRSSSSRGIKRGTGFSWSISAPGCKVPPRKITPRQL